MVSRIIGYKIHGVLKFFSTFSTKADDAETQNHLKASDIQMYNGMD
jgi:hypothetical protein